VQSLELLLDPDADARVRAVWQRLVDADLPSQARHRGASNAPHVTLIAAGGIPIPTAVAGLPLPLVLGPPTLLGAGGVRTLAFGVVPSAALLALHARVWEEAAPTEPTPFSAPGDWTPHVTLARRLPLADLPRALDAIGEDGIPATAVELRHWDAATRVVTRGLPSAPDASRSTA
jgi:hypothetical protein